MEKQDMQQIIDMLARIDADMKTHHEEMRAIQIKAEAGRKDLMAKLDAYSKTGQEEEKPAPGDTKPATEQQEEVPIVIPVGATMACLVMEARQEEEDPDVCVIV
jgi:hypothetical protein